MTHLYFRKILWLLALERLEEVRKQNQRDCCKTRDDGQRSFGSNVNRKIRPDSKLHFQQRLIGLNSRQEGKKNRERDKNVKK